MVEQLRSTLEELRYIETEKIKLTTSAVKTNNLVRGKAYFRRSDPAEKRLWSLKDHFCLAVLCLIECCETLPLFEDHRVLTIFPMIEGAYAFFTYLRKEEIVGKRAEARLSNGRRREASERKRNETNITETSADRVYTPNFRFPDSWENVIEHREEPGRCHIRRIHFTESMLEKIQSRLKIMKDVYQHTPLPIVKYCKDKPVMDRSFVSEDPLQASLEDRTLLKTAMNNTDFQSDNYLEACEKLDLDSHFTQIKGLRLRDVDGNLSDYLTFFRTKSLQSLVGEERASTRNSRSDSQRLWWKWKVYYCYWISFASLSHVSEQTYLTLQGMVKKA